jgi:hypothetical protein
LLVLEEEGGDHFFGEPALKLDDLMHVDFSGQGVISLLDATRLASRSPRVYATFLLWLLSELFEQLPEAGEAEKLKLVFFSTRPTCSSARPPGRGKSAERQLFSAAVQALFKSAPGHGRSAAQKCGALHRQPDRPPDRAWHTRFHFRRTPLTAGKVVS